MKKIICILCFIIAGIGANGQLFAQKQKVTWKDDTVKVDGTPYCVMIRKGNAYLSNDFSLRGLTTGTELIYFKAVIVSQAYGTTPAVIKYQANFIGTGSYAPIVQLSGLGMAKLTVENNLIKDGLIDLEAEKRFIQLQGGYMPKNTNNNGSYSTGVVVNNNININNSEGNTQSNTPTTQKSKSPIILNGNQIIRDSLTIGKFRQDTTTSTYSQKLYRLIIYSVDGEKVAEASVPIVNPEEWKITILADKKEYNIMYDSPAEKEKLFKWLADKGYLASQ